MADQATEHMSVSASPERCFAVVADIERYPEWAADIKEIVVDERDDQGRPAAGHLPGGRLRPQHQLHPGLRLLRGAPRPVLEADQGRHHDKLDGSYVFDPGEGSGTEVTYHLEVELRVPIPGLHQDARPEPHHVDGHAGAEGAGRVLGVTAGAAPPAGAGVAFGVDIGGTKVLGVALGAADRVVAEARVPTPVGPPRRRRGRRRDVAEPWPRWWPSSTPRWSAELASATGSAVEAAGRRRPPSAWAPRACWTAQGRLRFAPNLPQAHGVDWRVLIGRAPGRARRSSSRTTPTSPPWPSTGWARRGATRTCVMVTLGTGHRRRARSSTAGSQVGGARLRRRDRPHGGRPGRATLPVRAAGLLGALRLGRRAGPAGPRGGPGRAGCPTWWRLAGGDPESVRGEDVTAAALAGDPDARRVVEQVGWWVGFGLANLACVLDPECIVLGGGLVGAGDLLLDAARRAFAELVEGGTARPRRCHRAGRLRRAGRRGGRRAGGRGRRRRCG